MFDHISRLSSDGYYLLSRVSSTIGVIRLDFSVRPNGKHGEEVEPGKNKKRLELLRAFQGGDYLLSRVSSTIGVIRFNFSVRNGKRWSPYAIITLISWEKSQGGSLEKSEPYGPFEQFLFIVSNELVVWLCFVSASR